MLLTLLLTLSPLIEALPSHRLSQPDPTSWSQCPKGTFVMGMRLNLDDYEGPSLRNNDDIAITGIELHCGLPSFNTTHYNIRSQVYAPNRTWTATTFCPGLSSGLQVKSHSKTTTLKNDALGATSITMFCDGNTEFELGYPHLSQSVGPLQLCPREDALCAVTTEGMHWKPRRFSIFSFTDNLGLTNVSVKCCPVPNLENNCNPSDELRSVYEYDNSQGGTNVTITYEQTIGVTSLRGSSDSVSVNQSVSGFAQVGLSIPMVNAVRAKFKVGVGISKATGYDWSSTTEDTWSEGKTNTITTTVPAGRRFQVNQVVGSCGNLETYTNSFRTVWDPVRGFQRMVEGPPLRKLVILLIIGLGIFGTIVAFLIYDQVRRSRVKARRSGRGEENSKFLSNESNNNCVDKN